MKIFSPILKGTTTVAQGTTNLSGSFTGSLLGTAATASYADNFTVGGTLTAQTINVQIITSSIEFVTGSTRNGSIAGNTHQFTGSVLVTGSATTLLSVNNNVLFVSSSGNVGVGTAAPINRLHLATPTNGDISLRFSDQDDNESFGLVPEANSGNGKLYFMARSGYNTAFTSSTDAKITMQTNGNVGIGVTSLVSPGGSRNLLQISNGTNGAQIALGNSTTESNNARIFSGQYDLGFAAGVTTGIMQFYTNDTERMQITSGGNVNINGSGFSDVKFYVKGSDATSSNYAALFVNGSGTNLFNIRNDGAVTVFGSLSKGSGSFRIKHPLLSKKSTHQLVHSFIEGPQADLIYRGKIRLSAGKAIINIDEASTMTEGTFEALCREVQCFTTNETGWDAVKGKVTGNILTIESQNIESTDEISWMVVGERQDEHIMDTEWTDDEGKVIVEPLVTALENN